MLRLPRPGKEHHGKGVGQMSRKRTFLRQKLRAVLAATSVTLQAGLTSSMATAGGLLRPRRRVFSLEASGPLPGSRLS